MGNQCCNSNDPENERTIQINEDESKDFLTNAQPFQIKINNDQYFELSGIATKKFDGIFMKSQQEAFERLNEIKPLKNLIMNTLVKNDKLVKPEPGEFVKKELFGSNKIQGICVQNSVFFNGDLNGETALNFIYHSVLKQPKKSSQMKNEGFISFFTENNFDEKNTVNYEGFMDFINENWVNNEALRHFKLFLFNDFSANSKAIESLIQYIPKIKAKSLKSFELGLKTFNEDSKSPSLKESAIIQGISKLLQGKEQDLEAFSLILHTDDNQNQILSEVGELLRKTEKLSKFNLFLRHINTMANIAKFTENLSDKLPKITIFSIGLFSAEKKLESNISDDNLASLVRSFQRRLPAFMESFSFFISTNKGILGSTLALMQEIVVNKSFNGYNLALEGKYKNEEDIGEEIRARIKKKNANADIGIIMLDN